jgi:general secretion pathway protein G
MIGRNRKHGFTLVEILIVVVILGILAAIVIPQFTNASEAAKGSSILTQLQTIRSQIQLYQIDHNGDYPLLGTDWTQMTSKTDVFGTVAATGEKGPYLQQPPVNPFTESFTVAAAAAALGTPSATVGWVYNTETGEIKAVMETTKADDVFNDDPPLSDIAVY